MDEQKKLVYEIIIDCWNATKKYGFAPMTEADWKNFIKDTEDLSDKWKGRGSVAWMLYRRIIGGLTEAITAMQKGAN